jgi:rfaE bifunctional protein kinase chain/domain
MISTDELAGLIPKFAGARILVVGDLMLDTYLIGKAGRISPEAPVPVVRLDVRDDRLGGAANCAMNVAALGGVPVMMGAIGKKEAGERFIDIVHQHGFEDGGILQHDYFLTTRKVRVVAEGQQIVRVDEEEPLTMSDSFSRRVFDYLEKAVPTVDAVAVSDYAKGFINGELMTRLHDLARQKEIPILVDPKPVNIGFYKGVDLLKPNRLETSQLGGIDILDDRTCDTASLRVMYEYSPHALLVTRGRDGMDLYREDAEPVRIRSEVSHVYDVSGAGDTVLAVLALGYACKLDPVDACRLAAAAAAVVVRKPGTSTLTQEELTDELDSVSFRSDT